MVCRAVRHGGTDALRGDGAGGGRGADVPGGHAAADDGRPGHGPNAEPGRHAPGGERPAAGQPGAAAPGHLELLSAALCPLPGPGETDAAVVRGATGWSRICGSSRPGVAGAIRHVVQDDDGVRLAGHSVDAWLTIDNCCAGRNRVSFPPVAWVNDPESPPPACMVGWCQPGRVPVAPSRA